MSSGLLYLILFIVAAAALAAFYSRVRAWFKDNKEIDIMPGTVICIPVLAVPCLFSFNEGDIASMLLYFAAIALLIGLAIYDVYKLGLKDGLLTLITELVFSAGFLFVIIFTIVAFTSNHKRQRS